MRNTWRLSSIFFIAAVGLYLPTPGIARCAKESPSCAADFTLPNLAGQKTDFQELNNQLVLVHFWASWCQPCLEEFPKLIALQKDLGNKALIVAVSLDSDVKAVERFLKKMPTAGQKLLVLLDSAQKVSSTYGTTKLPETYVVDRTGVIRDKIIGSRDWRDGITVNYLKLLSLDQKP